MGAGEEPSRGLRSQAKAGYLLSYLGRGRSPAFASLLVHSAARSHHCCEGTLCSWLQRMPLTVQNTCGHSFSLRGAHAFWPNNTCPSSKDICNEPCQHFLLVTPFPEYKALQSWSLPVVSILCGGEPLRRGL